ncbi:MAG: putative DNA-binding protein (MmcQ/YjbR family) [Saprospiraceae bacterium]|jgi:predicted DNA-binding protein (MmcQ/YjbR family)
MNYEDVQSYCINKSGVTEEFPFDDVTLVFKVMGKMFALTPLNNEEASINLKCDPDRSMELRDEYTDIIAGFHMNKKHWNTVYIERELTDKLVFELIDHSYDLVVLKLTRVLKKELRQLDY